ncbi:MAG: NAD-dependent epimerase/dehydratase family protein [bacterium]
MLVTAGAGFIGSHLVDALLEEGHYVRILDNLDPQVHGKEQKIPEYLNKEAEFIYGDVRNRDQVKKAISDIEVIFHEAAVVGVAQSMYEVERYIHSNTYGTAVLWDVLINEPNKVKKVIVASSMSIYGEGEYRCNKCGIVYPKLRGIERLKAHKWEIECPKCGFECLPIPTGEEKPLIPTSIYAISKKDQEEMSIVLGRAYNIPVVALRYFNIYGPRQALSNPYTGVAAIFSSRILNNNPPLIFEDGGQSRDFIHVKDIVRTNLLAMKNDKSDYLIFNVGCGHPITIFEIANLLISNLNPTLTPQIANKFREGDIRHCFADVSKIKKELGFEAQISFEDGINDLIQWVKTQSADDLVDVATSILGKKGLTK